MAFDKDKEEIDRKLGKLIGNQQMHVFPLKSFIENLIALS